MPPTQKQLEKLLWSHQIHDPEYKAFREKTTKLEVIGLRVPVMRQLYKDHYKTAELSQDDLSRWDEIFRSSNLHEAMTICLIAVQDHVKTLTLKHWEILKHWIKRIENWEHSDNLSAIYSVLLEHHGTPILNQFKKWNTSQNPWEQRASIVPLIYYATPRRTAPPVTTVLTLIQPLIGQKDKYVNKAVGWTLRECYKLYPKLTLTFLKRHIGELSADGFSYSTERLTKEEKQKLKTIRKRRRP